MKKILLTVILILMTAVFIGHSGHYPATSFSPRAELLCMEKKVARVKPDGVAAFVDREGYREYVSEKEGAFKMELAKQ